MVLPRPTSSASSHRTGSSRCRTLGDVQLMREQPDAAAEERSEAAGLASREQVQDVEPGQEVLGLVDVARGQPLEQRPFVPPRRLRLRDEAHRCSPPAASVDPLCGEMDDQHPSLDRGDLAGAELGIETVGQVVTDGPGMHASDLTGSAP